MKGRDDAQAEPTVLPPNASCLRLVRLRSQDLPGARCIKLWVRAAILVQATTWQGLAAWISTPYYDTFGDVCHVPPNSPG